MFSPVKVKRNNTEAIPNKLPGEKKMKVERGEEENSWKINAQENGGRQE
jgi:hypothetical protein